MNIHEVTPKILTEFNAADLEFSGEASLPMFVNISFCCLHILGTNQ